MFHNQVGGLVIAAIAAAALTGSAAGAGRDTAAAAPVARDGPFGIAIGEPIGDLGGLENVGGEYRVISPPRPSPEVLAVYVGASPSTGVCMITGVSPPNHDDPNAVAAKQVVDQFESILASKYGAFQKKIDTCDNNGATCSRYLTQAIKDESASYVYVWAFKAPRPDHILGLMVFAHSLDANTTVAKVQYFGDNAQACANAQDAATSSAF